MKSKAPLALMEQLVMILVFALAAALCLQVFVFSDRVSAKNEQTDRAVLACQNAAELLKAAGQTAESAEAALAHTAHLLGGTFSDGLLSVYYGDAPAAAEAPAQHACLLRAQALPASVPGLCQARIWAEPTEGSDTPLFELTVAWQEVDARG